MAAALELVDPPGCRNSISRKLMEAGKHPAPEVAADPAVALKSLL